MNGIDNKEAQPQGESEITAKGLVKATLESAKLHRDKDVHLLGAIALVGMKAAFSERFSNKQLRNDPNLHFFNAVVWLGVEVNDAVDIIPKAREDENQEVIEDIFSSWKRILRASKNTAGASEERNNILTNYQREILFLEKQVREGDEEHSLSEIRTYREAMNAISVVHNAAALLGSEALEGRLDTINKSELSPEKLKDKYEWLVYGDPRNDTEKRLCALYNLVMGVQVIDDYCDIEDDRKLGLHTIATELLENVSDKSFAEDVIKEHAEAYFRKAEKFGVTKRAWKGMKYFFKTLKNLQKIFPDTAGGRRERLLNGGNKIIEEHTPET